MSAPRAGFQRGISYATSLWSAAFGAPHLWWALGIRYGFPGGDVSYEFFMSSRWRIAYDWFVIACSVAGVLSPLALLEQDRPIVPRWIPKALVWIAFMLLTLRGVAGIIVDRGRDLIWDPAFLIGGFLFGAVAWSARRPLRRPRP